MASVRCVDDALGFTGYGGEAADIPQNGRIMRNLIEGADMVMSHILHFYHLAALDYIDTTTTTISGQSPWWPKDNGVLSMVGAPLAQELVDHYVEALNIRRETHRMIAYADGKHPCTPALIPGGVTNIVRSDLKANMQAILGQTGDASGASIRGFIDKCYIPDVVTVAKAFSATLLVGDPIDGVGRGTKKYLAYGTFPKDDAGTLFITGGFLDATATDPLTWATQPLNTGNIKEYIGYSYYNEGGGTYDGKHPLQGVTKPLDGKPGAYSWLKAPRYVDGTKHVCEVGPLARVLVNYCAGVEPWYSTVNNFVTGTLSLDLTTGLQNLPSVLGRHAARALECQAIANTMDSWITSLSETTTADGTTKTYRHRNIPTMPSTGEGLTEAPRGALGHWIRVDGKKISNYQCVVPSTWNMSPKDTDGQMGPLELALSGTLVPDNDAAGRIRVGRIIRSFDPCIACAVHIVSPDKKTISKFEVVPNR